MFRYKTINIGNVKSVKFIDDEQSIEVSKEEIESITYDKKLKIYIVELDEGLIYNPKAINITYD